MRRVGGGQNEIPAVGIDAGNHEEVEVFQDRFDRGVVHDVLVVGVAVGVGEIGVDDVAAVVIGPKQIVAKAQQCVRRHQFAGVHAAGEQHGGQRLGARVDADGGNSHLLVGALGEVELTAGVGVGRRQALQRIFDGR